MSEVVQGPGGEPDYPAPWARTASSSFLATLAETRANLAASGFTIESLRDTTEASFAYAAHPVEVNRRLDRFAGGAGSSNHPHS